MAPPNPNQPQNRRRGEQIDSEEESEGDASRIHQATEQSRRPPNPTVEVPASLPSMGRPEATGPRAQSGAASRGDSRISTGRLPSWAGSGGRGGLSLAREDRRERRSYHPGSGHGDDRLNADSSRDVYADISSRGRGGVNISQTRGSRDQNFRPVRVHQAESSSVAPESSANRTRTSNRRHPFFRIPDIEPSQELARPPSYHERNPHPATPNSNRPRPSLPQSRTQPTLQSPHQHSTSPPNAIGPTEPSPGSSPLSPRNLPVSPQSQPSTPRRHSRRYKQNISHEQLTMTEAIVTIGKTATTVGKVFKSAMRSLSSSSRGSNRQEAQSPSSAPDSSPPAAGPSSINDGEFSYQEEEEDDQVLISTIDGRLGSRSGNDGGEVTRTASGATIEDPPPPRYEDAMRNDDSGPARGGDRAREQAPHSNQQNTMPSTTRGLGRGRGRGRDRR